MMSQLKAMSVMYTDNNNLRIFSSLSDGDYYFENYM